KETKNKTSFPLNNIHDHQVSHMKQILKQKGICFLLIKFSYHDSVFLLPFRKFMVYWDRYKSGGKKSITKQEIERDGYLIPYQYRPRIDYIKIVDQLIKIESEALKLVNQKLLIVKITKNNIRTKERRKGISVEL